MKKTHLLLIAIILTVTCISQQASAKIWRVNNKSNYNGSTLWGDNFGGTSAYPVFTQIDNAIKFVNDEDTIYIEPSTIIYNGATITKKIVLIGSGYFLTSNPEVSNNALGSNIAAIDFDPGSEGSQVIGLNIVYYLNGSSARVYVNTNNITVKRCRIETGIEFQSNLLNVYILENFFSNNNTSNCLITNGVGSFIPPTDITFNNNICQKTLIWSGVISQCNNNVFDGPSNTLNLQFLTDDFKNNILKATNATVNITASEGTIAYNIGTLSTQFGTSNNNLVVSAINSLFVSSASPDGTYQIADGSAANNSGSDGTDRGAFGGVAITDRYTLSGLAAIPVIYSVTTLGATATNLPVTIQARTIK